MHIYIFMILLKGRLKGGQWSSRTDIESNFAKLSAKPYPGYQRFFSRAAGIFGFGRRGPTHLPP